MTHHYIGTKIVLAWPTEGKDGQPGYGVKYEDGYISWSPKETFEAAYRDIEGPVQALTFGDALHMLKMGKKVARTGWNGKGMWVCFIHPGNAMHLGLSMQPCFGLKNAAGNMQPGWVPSIGDCLAEDWQVVG